MYLVVSLSQRDIISSIDLFFSRDWAGLEDGADVDAAMAGATGLFEPAAPAVVVVVDTAGLLLNSDPAPRDGVAVAAVVVLVGAGAVVAAGVKKFGVGAVDVVDTGAVGLSVLAAGAIPKRFEAAAGAVLEPPNKFEVGAVVVVGVEAAVAGGPPNRGFCAAVPALPKMDGVEVVGAAVGAGAIRVLLASPQVQRTFAIYHLLVWAPPKRFGLVVVGVEAGPNILLIVGVEAAAAPPPNTLLVVAVVGAVADLAGPPKIFDALAGFPPNSPAAGVGPALAVGNKPGEAAVVLSTACVVAAGPNICIVGFAASAVGVAGLSPPAEELPNIPPVGAADLFPPKIPALGVEAAARAVGGFPKVLDPVPNSAEFPVPPAAPPKAVVAPLPNGDVLVVGVGA